MNIAQLKTILSLILMLGVIVAAFIQEDLIEKKLLVSIALVFGLIAYHNLSKFKSLKNE